MTTFTIDAVPDYVAEHYIVDISGNLISRDEWRDRRDCAAAFREMERLRKSRIAGRWFAVGCFAVGVVAILWGAL